MLYDLVAVTTATTGTGTLTLGSAVAGFRSFSGASIPNGTVVSYAIENGAQRETGTGTYTVAGSTLTRTLKASSTGALLNLSGPSTVFITALASDIQTRDEKAVANGYASLNSSGNIPSAQLNTASAATVRTGTSTTTIMSVKNTADAVGTVVVTPATAAAGLDFSQFFNAEITLTANLTLGLPSGGYDRKSGEIDFVQNATGGWTLAFHANYIVPAGFALQATANGRTSVPYRYQADGKVRLYNPSKWTA